MRTLIANIFLVTLVGGLSAVQSAVAEERIALVIGNGGYGNSPLSDPPNDANLIAKTLRQLGFDVTQDTDVSQKKMRRLMRDFGKRLKKQQESVGVFYYSGHGMQISGQNYLIPVGANIESEDDVAIEGVALNELTTRLNAAHNAANLLFLDACRDNPFEKSFKSTSRGLARVDVPGGTLLAFAAEPYKVALQGPGSYSYFTEALAEQMVKPGLSARDILLATRAAVYNATGSKQLPVVEDRMLRKFYFKPPTSVQRIAVVGDTQKNDVPSPEMVAVPDGCFDMGSPSGEGINSERPQHRVCVNAFLMSKYEVTFEQYDQFAAATRRTLPKDEGWGRGERPVINVSWDDAKAYAAWLSGQTGKRYRLPTEAEWEYAARAGTTTAFWWGDEVGKSNANCSGCGSQWDGRRSAPVGSFAPNPWGLYDTAGNVHEWVADCWHEDYEGAPMDGSAWLEANGGECRRRVRRGGSWLYGPGSLRSAARYWSSAGGRDGGIGFRLAQDP